MFKIESDIPPPPGRINASYKFERMQPGDSFIVPAGGDDLESAANRVRWAVKKYRRTHAPEAKFRTAVKTTGVRVWRVV